MSKFPGRLYHETPSWVQEGSLFHIRIRAEVAQSPSLIDPEFAVELLAAAQRYYRLSHWWCELFFLMPDHTHAILGFPRESGMRMTMRNWKRGTARFPDVEWQEGFFDHRLRTTAEAQEKWAYIFRNPVVKGLCADESSWPWWWSAVTPNPKVARLDLKSSV